MKGSGKLRRPGLSLRAIAETGEARALAERMEETARLERARGGEVEQGGGRMRVTASAGRPSRRSPPWSWAAWPTPSRAGTT